MMIMDCLEHDAWKIFACQDFCMLSKGNTKLRVWLQLWYNIFTTSWSIDQVIDAGASWALDPDVRSVIGNHQTGAFEAHPLAESDLAFVASFLSTIAALIADQRAGHSV
jgi:hypothetical protein